jgi:hypothetical protein
MSLCKAKQYRHRIYPYVWRLVNLFSASAHHNFYTYWHYQLLFLRTASPLQIYSHFIFCCSIQHNYVQTKVYTRKARYSTLSAITGDLACFLLLVNRISSEAVGSCSILHSLLYTVHCYWIDIHITLHIYFLPEATFHIH